jgi:hypothetical protein
MAGRAPPRSLSEWHTCLLDAYELVEPAADEELGPNARLAEPGAKGRAVLAARARWGDSAFRTEYVWGELLVELAMPLRVGAAQNVTPDGPSVYSHGSIIARRAKLAGTVLPVDIRDDRVTLHVDLRTSDGAERFQETLTVPVGKSEKACGD